MVKPEIIEEAPISMAQVKEHLAQIKKRDEELNFRANKTEEYLNDFVKLDAAKIEELKAKIEKLGIVRLKQEQLTKLLDLLPTKVEEVKVILQAYPAIISKKDMESIVTIIKEFVS